MTRDIKMVEEAIKGGAVYAVVPKRVTDRRYKGRGARRNRS